jgi:hypothetical protein
MDGDRTLAILSPETRSGLSLISLIVVTVFLGLVSFPIGYFLTHSQSLTDVQSSLVRARYLARMGISKALYDYRLNGVWNPGETLVQGSEYYVLGGTQAKALRVDYRNSLVSGNNLQGIDLQNTASAAMTLQALTVSWVTSAPAEQVTGVSLGGVSVWTGSASSGAMLDITDTLLVNPTLTALAVTFNVLPSGQIFTLTFHLSDGSSRTVRMGDNLGGSNRFTVRSAGEVRLSDQTHRYTLEGTYEANTGELVSLERGF